MNYVLLKNIREVCSNYCGFFIDNNEKRNALPFMKEPSISKLGENNFILLLEIIKPAWQEIKDLTKDAHALDLDNLPKDIPYSTLQGILNDKFIEVNSWYSDCVQKTVSEFYLDTVNNNLDKLR